MELKIQVHIKSSINKVWEFWTLPKHITNWNFASDDWQCPFAENDVVVGGKYRARMEAKDGSFGFDFEYTYEEVIHHQKLVYFIVDGRRVETTFRENDNSIELITRFEPEKLNSPELQQKGWQSILDNFKTYVERN